MIRRTPDAIVIAHRMDPARRELYVEGHRDRLFFCWLMGLAQDVNTKVIEISAVDLPNVEAGG